MSAPSRPLSHTCPFASLGLAPLPALLISTSVPRPLTKKMLMCTQPHTQGTMSSSMEFWATCVKPNKPVKVSVQDGMTLRLTQVAPHHLARGRAARGGRERVRRGSVCETPVSGGGGGSPLGRAPASPAHNMLACGAWRIHARLRRIPRSARRALSCFSDTRYVPQCSLGETVKPGRSVLKVQASGKNCVLASLMADKIESSVLELMFEEVGAAHVWFARNRNARLATRSACAPRRFARPRREFIVGRLACVHLNAAG